MGHLSKPPGKNHRHAGFYRAQKTKCGGGARLGADAEGWGGAGLAAGAGILFGRRGGHLDWAYWVDRWPKRPAAISRGERITPVPLFGVFLAKFLPRAGLLGYPASQGRFDSPSFPDF